MRTLLNSELPRKGHLRLCGQAACVQFSKNDTTYILTSHPLSRLVSWVAYRPSAKYPCGTLGLHFTNLAHPFFLLPWLLLALAERLPCRNNVFIAPIIPAQQAAYLVVVSYSFLSFPVPRIHHSVSHEPFSARSPFLPISSVTTAVSGCVTLHQDYCPGLRSVSPAAIHCPHSCQKSHQDLFSSRIFYLRELVPASQYVSDKIQVLLDI